MYGAVGYEADDAMADVAGKGGKRKTKRGNDQDALYALADEKAQRTGAAPGQDDMYALMSPHSDDVGYASTMNMLHKHANDESNYALAVCDCFQLRAQIQYAQDAVAQRTKPASGQDDMYAIASPKAEGDYAEAINHATESEYALADAKAERTGPASGQEDMYAGVPAADGVFEHALCVVADQHTGTYALADSESKFGFEDATDRGYLNIGA